jgi:hypothetical protein
LMSRSPVFALYSPNMTNRKCNWIDFSNSQHKFSTYVQ